MIVEFSSGIIYVNEGYVDDGYFQEGNIASFSINAELTLANIEFSATLNCIANITSVIGVVYNQQVSLEAFADSFVQCKVTTTNSIDLTANTFIESIIAINRAMAITTTTIANLDAQSAITADISSTLNASTTLTSDISINTNVTSDVTSSFNVVWPLNPGVPPGGTAIKDFIWNVDSQFQTITIVGKVIDFDSNITSTFNTTITSDKLVEFNTNLTSTTTQTTNTNILVDYISNLNSEFNQHSIEDKLVRFESNLTSTFNTNIDAIKFVGYTSNTLINTTLYVDVSVIKVNLIPYLTYIIPREEREYIIEYEEREFTI